MFRKPENRFEDRAEQLNHALNIFAGLQIIEGRVTGYGGYIFDRYTRDQLLLRELLEYIIQVSTQPNALTTVGLLVRVYELDSVGDELDGADGEDDSGEYGLRRAMNYILGEVGLRRLDDALAHAIVTSVPNQSVSATPEQQLIAAKTQAMIDFLRAHDFDAAATPTPKSVGMHLALQL